MSTRQDSRDELSALDILKRLAQVLNQADQPEIRLQPFLEMMLQTLRDLCPDIARAEVYLRGDVGTSYRRWAGLGVPQDAPIAPEPKSSAALALTRREPVFPEAESGMVSWGIPLLTEGEALGVLRVDLPATSSSLPAIQAALLALVPSLCLGIQHVQSHPFIRALVLSQQLVATRTEQDMIGVVAEYVGKACPLLDLTLYEYKEEQFVCARSTVLAMPDTSELTDFSTGPADYPLSTAIPKLVEGHPIQIDDVYNTPLIAADKHEYFHAQSIKRLTLFPLVVDERVLGVLSVADQQLTPNELRGLQTLSNHIAVLVQNRALFKHTASALDEIQQVYRFGSAVLEAKDAASLLEAVYKHFSAPPDELALETVHLNEAGNPLAFVTQALITAQGSDESAKVIDVATYHLEAYAQLLEDGTPVLINNIDTDPSVTAPARAYFTGRRLQALAAFPIVLDGKLSNALTAAYFSPHIYTAAEIRLLHRLSEQIGLEIRNWQLLQKTQEQTKQLSHQVRLLESLYETSRQISAGLAKQDVLRTTCKNLAGALELGYAAILHCEQASTGCSVMAEHPAHLETEAPITLDGFGAYQHLQRYQTPIIVQQIESAGDLLGPNQERFKALGLRSMLLAPLLVQGDLIGLLVLAVTETVRSFSQAEMNVAQAIAAQIASSLRNAELFGEIQQRASQLEQIAAFGRRVTSTFDRNEILRHLVDVIPALLPADQVSLVLYSDGQPRMRVLTLAEDARTQEVRWPAEGSSIKEIVQTQMPMLIPDLPSSTYSDHKRMAAEGLNAALLSPLIVGNNVTGAINIGHKRARVYTPTDLTLLQQVGSQVAVALENARSFDVAQQHAAYDKSLSQITIRLQQQSDLRDLLQQTMRDLGGVLGAQRARVRLQTNAGPNGAKTREPEE
ncbi:MAG: GAF domain-containing protein [Anaerolineae bacterium]|nr:GAF domain-containing protein [Anaerolineae bacterium]